MIPEKNYTTSALNAKPEHSSGTVLGRGFSKASGERPEALYLTLMPPSACRGRHTPLSARTTPTPTPGGALNVGLGVGIRGREGSGMQG